MLKLNAFLCKISKELKSEFSQDFIVFLRIKMEDICI